MRLATLCFMQKQVRVGGGGGGGGGGGAVCACGDRPMLSHWHVVCTLPPGSGKTLAYLIPIMARLKRLPRHPHPGAIIVVPTRELAVQVEGVAAKLFAPSKKKAKHRRQALQHQPQQRGRKGGHKPGIARDVVVRRAVGRVSRRMQASFERDPPDVLVATPQVRVVLCCTGCIGRCNVSCGACGVWCVASGVFAVKHAPCGSSVLRCVVCMCRICVARL